MKLKDTLNVLRALQLIERASDIQEVKLHIVSARNLIEEDLITRCDEILADPVNVFQWQIACAMDS